MRQPKWLSSALVTAIHDEAIYEFGGLAGVRDTGLLESAIYRPRNRLAYEPESSLFDLAAALCVGIAKNDPFIDGNKRTALLATRAFWASVDFPDTEVRRMMISEVSDGKAELHAGVQA